jgi:ribosomal-protein-alanine N-acetyltransferase
VVREGEYSLYLNLYNQGLMKEPFLMLETQRLNLKGITNQQMFEIFEHWSREDIQQFFQYASEEAYQQDLYKHQNNHASYNRQFLAFLLIEKESGEVIGRCGIHNWNKENERAEIGYAMEKEEWKNKGLMSEAVEKNYPICF